jgi:hypothetical protein
MYYVYKVINKTNQKFYIGKRKHDFPHSDRYMGSGKLIKQAIKKHGRDNFIKEILEIFSTDEEASQLENQLITKELINSGLCYNMHEGGRGGFWHINGDPIKRAEVTEKARVWSKKHYKGTANWTEDSWRRVREQSFSEKIKRGEFNPNNWDKLSEEKKTQIRTEASKFGQMFGWYINIKTMERKKFRKDQVPDEWISVHIHNENRMKKSRRWYNDGEQNYYILSSDPKVHQLCLVKGRLKQRKL